ncbi:hypothetical protein ES705_16314 [subsurface metagenome]
MAIEDPQTYAEWYWKNSVDAGLLASENAEKTYAPVVKGLLHDSGLYEFMPDFFKPLFDILSKPTEGYWDDLQRDITHIMTQTTSLIFGKAVARPGMYEYNRSTLNLKIDPDMAAIMTQRKWLKRDIFDDYVSYEGYGGIEAKRFYESRLPYPTIPEIIGTARYLAPVDNYKEWANKHFDIPESIWDIWNWQTWQRLTTEQVQSLYVRDTWQIDRTDKELKRLGWQADDLLALHTLAYEVPNAMLMLQGGLIQNKSETDIAKNIAKAGIHPEYAIDYVNAILTKPASEDIVAYELRRDPSLSNLGTELRRIGIHPNYNSLYKELAYQIPPVADIITMAVREAFTPDIAARFGQYQDLPSQFVEWVGKKGLSKEWAERYWAAHWSLPSPQQGFEMLHRGVIGEGDLNMLMRALDIMPFWRDKLIQIAYRPLTRVDVRRMFALGVLDVSGVRKAYTDLGYNDYNADLMTNFTIKYTEGIETRREEAKEKVEQREQEAREKAAQKEQEAREKALIPKVSEFTTAQTLKFLTAQLITEERAIEELELLGYNEERIKVYLASVKPVS